MEDKIRIFIVDDNLMARNMLSNLLSSQDDFLVVGEAGTGQSGIIQLDEVRPDIVMLETGISGGMALIDIVKEIKNISPGVGIVLCADASSIDSVIAASATDVDDFISKPYKKNTILRAVREVAAKREQ